MERIERAQEAHSQEYTDAIWVNATDLIHSITSSQPLTPQHLHPHDQGRFKASDTFELFRDFETLLRENTVQSILSDWGKRTPSHTFRRLRTYQYSSPSTFQISWTPVTTTAQDTKGLAPSDTAFLLPYGKNASAHQPVKTYTKLDGRGNTESLSLPSPLNPALDRVQFTQAVIRKSRALVELKSSDRRGSAFIGGARGNPPSITTPESWKSLIDEFRKASPTERHLKWVLKDDFKEGRTLEAYQSNIRTYLDLLNTQKYMMTRDKVPITDAIVNKLATLLHQEVEALQHPTDPRLALYHGASGEFGELYTILSLLRETLQATAPLGSDLGRPQFTESPFPSTILSTVRGTDMYYQKLIEAQQNSAHGDLTPVEIFHTSFMSADYAPLVMATRICANPALTCGPDLGASTSNSVEYWLKGHSVLAIAIQRFFDEALALLGIPGEFSLFDSVLRQYYGVAPEGQSNGLMVQLFATPEFLENYTHANHIYAAGRSPKLSAALDNKASQHQYANIVSLLPTDNFWTHFPEIWIYPTPARPADSLRFLSYRLHDLDGHTLRELRQHLEEVWEHVVTEWLLLNTRIQEGALHGGDPFVHKLHRFASRLHAGDFITEAPSPNALRHLIELDMDEAVRALLREKPASIETIPEPDRRPLLLNLIIGGQDKMAKILSHIFYGTEDYASWVTPEEAHLAVTVSLQDLEERSNIDTLKTLDTHFNFKRWDQSYHDWWSRQEGLMTEAALPYMTDLINLFGESFARQFIKNALMGVTRFSLEYAKAHPLLIQAISINDHFERWAKELELLSPDQLKNNTYSQHLMEFLHELGINWAQIYQGRPLISFFLNVNSIIASYNGNPPVTKPGIMEMITMHPFLLNIKDTEGRNLRQMAETQLIHEGISFKDPDILMYSSLSPLFPEFDSEMGNVSNVYRLLRKTPPENRSEFWLYLKDYIYHRKRLCGLQSCLEIDQANEDFARTHMAQIDALSHLGNIEDSEYSDFWPREKSEALRKESQSIKDKLLDACANDDPTECQVLKENRWNHLLGPTLVTALHHQAHHVLATLLNEFPTVLDEEEVYLHLLDNPQSYVSLSDLYCNQRYESFFFQELLPHLTGTSIQKIFHKRGVLMDLDGQDVHVKKILVSKLPLMDLHTTQLDGISLLSVLLDSVETQEDGEWVEKVAPALGWIDKRTLFPYMVKCAINMVHKGIFHHYEDMIDLSPITQVSPITHLSPHQLLLAGGAQNRKALQALAPFLKKKRLI